MIEKSDFVKLISSIQDYYEKLSKIEAVLDCTLENYCKLPDTVLDYIIEKTNKVWTDEIFDMIYNCASPELIYEKVLKL